MKKIISILMCIVFCTAAVYAAVPETVNSKQLVEITTIGETNVDNGDNSNFTGSIKFDGIDSGDVSRVLKSSDDLNDYCIKVSKTADENRRMYTPSGKSYPGGIWVVNFSLMQPEAFGLGISIKIDDNWFSGDYYKLTQEGTLVFGSNVIKSGITPGKWYEYTIMYDCTANTSTCIVVDDEGEIVTSNEMPVTAGGKQTDFSYINYIEIALSQTGRVFYMDDCSCKIYGYKPELDVFGIDEDDVKRSDGVNYSAPRIKAVVSEKINVDTIDETIGAALYLGEKEVPSQITFDDVDNAFVFVPDETLLPNTEYTVKFTGNIKSLQGVSIKDTTATVKTIKQPYGINNAEITTPDITSGGDISVSVEINNREAVSTENAIIAIVYDGDGALCSINSTKTSGTADKVSYPLSLKASDDISNMKVKILFVESLTNQKLIDMLELEQ